MTRIEDRLPTFSLLLHNFFYSAEVISTTSNIKFYLSHTSDRIDVVCQYFLLNIFVTIFITISISTEDMIYVLLSLTRIFQLPLILKFLEISHIDVFW